MSRARYWRGAGRVVRVALRLLGALTLLAILAPLLANDLPYTIRGRFAGVAQRCLREVSRSGRTFHRLLEGSRPRSAEEVISRNQAVNAELKFLRTRTKELENNVGIPHRAAVERFSSRVGELASWADQPPDEVAERTKRLATAAAALVAAYPSIDPNSSPSWLAERRVWPLLERLPNLELFFMLAALAGGVLLITHRLGLVHRLGLGRRSLTRSTPRSVLRQVAGMTIPVVFFALASTLLVRQAIGHDPSLWSYKTAIRRGHIEVASALFPPVPFGPREVNHTSLSRPPLWRGEDGAVHVLGTDESGRDVLTLVIWGSRVSLTVALLSTILLTGLGGMVGAMAGFFGGPIDFLLSRVIEVVQSIPAFLAIMAVLAFANRSVGTIAAVMALLLWPSVARLVRAEFLRLRTLDWAIASRALGCAPLRVITHHLLPNALGPALVAATFAAAGAIFVESGLSFLGLGVSGETPSWGALLAAARRAPYAWWLSLFPGLLIFGTVACFNLLGEGLREAADPQHTATSIRVPKRTGSCVRD